MGTQAPGEEGTRSINRGRGFQDAVANQSDYHESWCEQQSLGLFWIEGSDYCIDDYVHNAYDYLCKLLS